MINLAPTTAVEVHLAVSGADERLGGEDGVARLLAVVAEHSPVAARKLRRGGAGDGAAAAAGNGG